MSSRLFFKEGSIGGIFGVNGGASGTGFGGPTANPADPTGNANLANSYNQLQQVAQGNGPNPAMAQYNQNIQNQAKQQAGAISSVQGISPALAARMASQQGSAAMQNSAGQGATTQAEQQLGAMGQAASVAGQQASIAAGMQQNVNNANAGLAGGIMGQQSTAIGGMFNSAGQMMGMMGGGARGGVVGKDFGFKKMAGGGDVGSSGPMSQFAKFLSSSAPNPGPVATQSFTMPSTVASTSGGSVGAPSPASNKGSENPSVGAEVSGPGDSAGSPSMYTDGNYGQSAMDMNTGPSITSDNYGSALMNRDSGMGASFARGGRVPALLSPGETYIPPGKLNQAAKSANPLAAGKKVPGKPKVAGNSYANDVVPAKLEAGGVVIPNSIMQSKYPAAGARDFIAGIIAKRKAHK